MRAYASSTRSVAVILMGAGHAFGDNLAQLGLADKVALAEITPRRLVEVAKQ